jgi:hypothetical protein
MAPMMMRMGPPQQRHAMHAAACARSFAQAPSASSVAPTRNETAATAALPHLACALAELLKQVHVGCLRVSLPALTPRAVEPAFSSLLLTSVQCERGVWSQCLQATARASPLPRDTLRAAVRPACARASCERARRHDGGLGGSEMRRIDDETVLTHSDGHIRTKLVPPYAVRQPCRYTNLWLLLTRLASSTPAAAFPVSFLRLGKQRGRRACQLHAVS